jgi:hypothetical protein
MPELDLDNIQPLLCRLGSIDQNTALLLILVGFCPPSSNLTYGHAIIPVELASWIYFMQW